MSDLAKVTLYVHGQARGGYGADVHTFENVIPKSIDAAVDRISFDTDDGRRVISTLMYVVELPIKGN